jgi:hypothetical protein
MKKYVKTEELLEELFIITMLVKIIIPIRIKYDLCQLDGAELAQYEFNNGYLQQETRGHHVSIKLHKMSYVIAAGNRKHVVTTCYFCKSLYCTLMDILS